MAYFPNPVAHDWDELVIGGSSAQPVMFLLNEQNLLTNGYFKDTIVNWDGTVTRRAATNAMRGSYVMEISQNQYAHQAIAVTDFDKIFTGFLNLRYHDIEMKVRLYPSNSATRDASPTDYIDLDFSDANGGISEYDWCPFYVSLFDAGWSGSYLHLEFQSSNIIGNTVWVDDLRLYSIDSYLEMNCPNTLNLNWQRLVDGEYPMENGDLKSFVRGWRAVYQLGYEYCSRAEMLRHIDISENTFCCFVPQNDSTQYAYIRMTNDLNASYFNDRYNGHQDNLELTSVFKQRYKNKQYGRNYFSVTFN